MRTTKTVDTYINDHPNWENELRALRSVLRQTELEECIKWGAPCYTLNGENIVGMMGFKNYVGIWFHQGVFLNDSARVLINAQEGKTKALRQWRFTSAADIDSDLLGEYVKEAIENAKAGRKLGPSPKKALTIPDELKNALKSNSKAHEKFDELKPGKQREFAEYISEAKRADTKVRRIEKIIPMILSNVGLNDKYK